MNMSENSTGILSNISLPYVDYDERLASQFNEDLSRYWKEFLEEYLAVNNTPQEDNSNMSEVNYDDLIGSLAQRYGITNLKDIDTSSIPRNKKSYLTRETTSRFSGAEWFKLIQTKHISLAGLGGIGSHTAFMLSRVHPASMTFYDDDTVEPANMSGQLFGRNDFTEKHTNK